jgi:hypothetical protein
MGAGTPTRRAPSARWIEDNPVLPDGEVALETDTDKIKVGDGVTPWKRLPYLVGVSDPAQVDPPATGEGDLEDPPASGSTRRQVLQFTAAGLVGAAGAGAVVLTTHLREDDSSRTQSPATGAGPAETGLAPTANPTFTGTVGLPGGRSGNPRLPVNGAVEIDGAITPSGTGDKVGYSFAATIKGGFLDDAGGNPQFVWGGNDYTDTGTARGDLDGLDTLYGRETELHLQTPGATIGRMTGLQVDCGVSSQADMARVGTAIGLYLSAVAKEAQSASVDKAYGLYIDGPTAGTLNEAVHVVGSTSLVGKLDVNGPVSSFGSWIHEGGPAQFVGPMNIVPASEPGVHIGMTLTSSGRVPTVTLTDGTTEWSIDFDGDGLRLAPWGGTPPGDSSAGGAPPVGGVTVTTSGIQVGGGALYVEAGALKYRGPSGTVTTIAPA